VPAAQEPSGATVQPETSPADTTHTADLEGEGQLLAEEGAIHARIVVAEVGLSQQYPQAPTHGVHAQTVGAKLEAISGQPGNPNVNTPEPDSTPGEEINANTHFEGAEPQDSMDEGIGRLVEVEEDGAARKTAGVEGDTDPRIELQEPGVSCLATQENTGSLTLSSPLTTPEAARTQRSSAVNTGIAATPEPEDRGADLDPQPHDPPQPEEAPGNLLPTIPPEQIRAPHR
jgi:hypothetical protein